MGTFRKMKRYIAKRKMKEAGMTKFCKHSHSGHPWQRVRIESVFSKKWREYV